MVNITRIEMDGDAGHVAVERKRGSDIVRIDSIIRNPKKQRAWKTWEIPADAGVYGRMKIAREIQVRSDGFEGKDTDVLPYVEAIQKFVY